MNDNEKIDTIRKSIRDIILHIGSLEHQFEHVGSISQCYALQKLGERDLTPVELSCELLLDRTTVSRLAKSLIEQGYIKSETNQKDRRSHLLKLTALGREKVYEINRIARGQVQVTLQNLSPEHQIVISSGVSLYAQALKENSRKRTSLK
jgi:DNA-binding MarR family transcriptional regulator